MPNYITREGLKHIQALYATTRDALRAQADIVRQAIDSGGGTHDNAMYDAALQQQRVLAEREEHLRELLGSPAFIEDLRTPEGVVTIGKTVTVENLATGTVSVYTILGPGDAEIRNDGRTIAHTSPLAQQLLGAREGDVVDIEVPSGFYEGKIQRVQASFSPSV